MKKILILGAGNSGKSAAKLAKLQGDAVTLLDSGTPDVQIDGVQVITGKAAETWSGPADLVIYSPGIPLGSRLDEIGIATGAPRISELAYGASRAAGNYVLTLSGLSSDDTYQYVMKRENELTMQQQKQCLDRVLSAATQ